MDTDPLCTNRMRERLFARYVDIHGTLFRTPERIAGGFQECMISDAIVRSNRMFSSLTSLSGNA